VVAWNPPAGLPTGFNPESERKTEQREAPVGKEEKRFDPLRPSGYCFLVNRHLNLNLLLNALLLGRAAVGF